MEINQSRGINSQRSSLINNKRTPGQSREVQGSARSRAVCSGPGRRSGPRQGGKRPRAPGAAAAPPRRPAPGAARPAPTQEQQPVRLLQVAPLLAEHAVDAAAHLPRLALRLALLRAPLVRASPPLRPRVGFGPRARRAPAGAPGERGRRHGSPCRRDPGRAGRFRGRARGVLRGPEEQRPQTVAQPHAGAAGAAGRRRAHAGPPAPGREGAAPAPRAGVLGAGAEGRRPSPPGRVILHFPPGAGAAAASPEVT